MKILVFSTSKFIEIITRIYIIVNVFPNDFGCLFTGISVTGQDRSRSSSCGFRSLRSVSWRSFFVNCKDDNENNGGEKSKESDDN